MRNIVVLRALPGLGDMLCAVPALRAIRTGYPDARIVLIGLPSATGFVTRFPDLVDELAVLPGFPGLPEQPVDARAVLDFLAAMQARGFDLALQMQGSGGVANALVGLLGAGRCAGFRQAGETPEGDFYPYPDDLPEIRRWLALCTQLGLPTGDAHIGFPVSAAERQEAEALAPAGRFAIVHPGASVAARRWPAARFAVVADALAARGHRVLLSGTAGEADLCAAVASAMSTPATVIAGATALGTLAALLERAALLIANDTGVSHLAAALRCPSVVLFTGSDRARWAPLDGTRHVAVGGGQADGSASPAAPPSVEEVLEAVARVDDGGLARVA